MNRIPHKFVVVNIDQVRADPWKIVRLQGLMVKVGRADAGRCGNERIGRDRARQRLLQRDAERA